MKTALTCLFFAFGTLIVLVGGTALYLHLSGIPRYKVETIDLHVAVTSERVARGKLISSMLCTNCHQNPTTQLLTGWRMVDLPAKFGVVYSRNITKHPTKGIGAWTDGELAFFLRTGIKRDGRLVPIAMPRFPLLADEDLFSVIAFLRSDDPLVQAADVEDKDSQYSFLVKILARTARRPFAYPSGKIEPPDVHDQVAYGKYLVTGMLHCFACHSADFSKINLRHPEASAGYLGGGNRMLDINGRTIYTPNITFDPETGIGRWTEAQFIHAMKDGFRADNTPILYPMIRFPELTDEEISAIYAYLKTVPISRKPRGQSAQYQVAQGEGSAGQQIYYKYSCYSCHGEDGLGNCDLRQAHRKYPTNDILTLWIRDPSRFVPHSKMPTWEGVIEEAEYEPLAEYVRLLGERSLRLAEQLHSARR